MRVSSELLARYQDVILDPRGAPAEVGATPGARRLDSLAGTTVALIDNGKPNAGLLLGAIAERLKAVGVETRHVFTKPYVGVVIDDATIEEIREASDFAIAALGDCGSCSAGTAQDSLILEQHGIPAVSICTRPFGVTAKAMAKSLGMPDFEVVFTDHPVASLNASEIEARADVIAPEIISIVSSTR